MNLVKKYREGLKEMEVKIYSCDPDDLKAYLFEREVM